MVAQDWQRGSVHTVTFLIRAFQIHIYRRPVDSISAKKLRCRKLCLHNGFFTYCPAIGKSINI